MWKIFLFILVGVLIITVQNIDLSNGLFLLHGSTKSIYDALFFIMLIILGIISTLLLQLKNRLIVYLLISVYFMIHHAIWFSIGQATGDPHVLIRESAPYFEKGYQYYMKWIYDERIEFHTNIFVIFYMLFVFTMGITLWIRKVVKAFIDHNKR